jgi:hypothetical protein
MGYFNPHRLMIAATSGSFSSLWRGTGSNTFPLVYTVCDPSSRPAHQPSLASIHIKSVRFIFLPLNHIIRIKCAFVNGCNENLLKALTRAVTARDYRNVTRAEFQSTPRGSTGTYDRERASHVSIHTAHLGGDGHLVQHPVAQECFNPHRPPGR